MKAQSGRTGVGRPARKKIKEIGPAAPPKRKKKK